MEKLLRMCFRNASEEKIRHYRGILVVIGAMLIMFTLGVLYTAGNMNTYMSSYIRARVDPTWTYSKGTWFYTTTQWAHGPSMIAAGFIEYKFGVRIVAIMGCLCCTIGKYATAITIKMNPLWSIATYGVLFGFKGMAYGVSIMCGMRWFPERKGAVSGIILSTFGLASFAWTPMQTAFLNPHDIAPQTLPPDPPTIRYYLDDDVLDRVPYVFIFMGSVSIVMQAIGWILIAPAPKRKHGEVGHRDNKEELGVIRVSEEKKNLAQEKPEVEGEIQDSEPNPASEEGKKSSSLDLDALEEQARSSVPEIDFEEGDTSLTPWNVFFTRQYYILFFTFFFNQQGMGYISNMYKVIGMSFIDSDAFLAVVGSFASVGNALGRPMWGTIMDHVGYKLAMLLVSGLMTFFYATLPFTRHLGKYAYAFWIVSMNLVVAGNYSLLPSCCLQTFGDTFASSNYGMVFAASLIGATIQSIMLSKLTPIFGDKMMMWMTAGFEAACFLLTLLFDKDPSPEAIRKAKGWPPYRNM